jgi:hypothetical protein
MTRRAFISMAPLAGVVPTDSQPVVRLPINIIQDKRAKLSAGQLDYFWSTIWAEAVRDLARCGIEPQISTRTGDIWRPPGRQPVVSGLDHGAINLVITDQIPVEWDGGRALSGVAMSYRGFEMCVLALNRAHGHLIPLISVNSCIHELLHVLLRDTSGKRPAGLLGEAREFRIDYFATRLWLLHDGAAIREATLHTKSDCDVIRCN